MRVLAAATCAALLAGCAIQAPTSEPSGGPVRVSVGGVPFHSQNGFQCGPAVMTMALEWTGMDMPPDDIARAYVAADDPRVSLAATANRFGRLAYPIHGTKAMTAELAAGHPVVIAHNLGVAAKPLWNCTIATGYDTVSDEVIMHSGDTANKRMARGMFERLWAETDEWGLVVLKAGDLPATVERAPYNQAAQALDRAGRHWEAVLAFDAALAKWPEDSVALMGLGGSLFRLGDRQGAADAYRAASAVAPDPAPALDALAQVMDGATAGGNRPD